MSDEQIEKIIEKLILNDGSLLLNKIKESRKVLEEKEQLTTSGILYFTEREKIAKETLKFIIRGEDND